MSRRSSEHSWFWLVLSFGLLLALPSAARAGEGEVDVFDDRALFVIGNTLFTVYHELGHALIDLLGLPVIGREEDAVDGFAAVTMIPDAPDEVRDALIVAVADGWRVQSDLGADRGKRRYWGVHALDEQRHFAIVCLMVGSDQDGFYDFALEAGLPERRIESCSHDFTSMKDGWKRLLAPHEPDIDAPASPLDPSIVLAFDPPLSDQEKLLDLVLENGVLEDAVRRFGDGIVLPRTVTVRFRPCADANAYWSGNRSEVTVCYELIDAFERIVLGSARR